MAQHHRGGQGRRPEEKPLEEYWPGYLRQSYFDGSAVRPELVSRQSFEDKLKDAFRTLTRSQVRRFFGHCRGIEARLKRKISTWADERAAICKLDCAAADSRAKRKIPQWFHDFIKTNVAKMKDERDFLQGFILHFEALLGFGAAFFSD